jgi:hypothetical protein
MLVGTIGLAQANPSYQNQPATVTTDSSSLRVLSSGQRATEKLKAAVHGSETPQVAGLNFANPVLYSSGGYQAESVAVADVNGDGKPDLVVANYCGTSSACLNGGNNPESSIAVLLGNGDGTFQTAVVYDSAGVNATSVAVADVNGDGHPDVIVTNACASTSSCANGSVAVLLNNGDGTLQPAVTYSSGGLGEQSSETPSVAVGSLRGNGVVDLVVSNCASISSPNCNEDSNNGVVSVLLGNGDGTFQSAVTYGSGGFGAYSVALADLRSDGKLDVVVTTGAVTLDGFVSSQAAVLLGNGDGTLQSPVIYNAGGADAGFEGLAVTDVNRDGKPDLIVANQCGVGAFCDEEEPASVSVLLGNGDGTFQTAVNYISGTTSANAVAVADFNGDGNQDLVVVGYSSGTCGGGGTISVMLGNGDGSFQAPIGFCSGGVTPFSVAAADVNGDQSPDIIATNALGLNCNSGPCEGFVAVLLNVVVQLAPGSLNFANQTLGTTSAPQTVTLTNTGKEALDISSIAITGPNGSEFSQTNTCGTSIPAGQGCTISVTFTPTASGNASASLNVSDSGAGSPQTVPLSGSARLGPVVSLSPSSISFPTQYVGTSGLPQTVTLTNTGAATLAITAVSTTAADFGVLSNCGNSVAAGASCSIGVFFDPTAAGNRTGALTITDNASGSPQSVSLAGVGQDFSMTPSGQTTATIAPGQSASYTISIAPGGGFKQTVTLSCSGAPAQSTCSVSPSSIALGGTSATTVTVTVTTAAAAALVPPAGGPSLDHPLGLPVVFSGTLGLALLLGVMPYRRRRPQLLYGLALLLLLSIGGTMTACGGGSGSSRGGTLAGTYNLTVTGSYTAGSVTLNHNTKLTLVVQ